MITLGEVYVMVETDDGRETDDGGGGGVCHSYRWLSCGREDCIDKVIGKGVQVYQYLPQPWKSTS